MSCGCLESPPAEPVDELDGFPSEPLRLVTLTPEPDPFFTEGEPDPPAEVEPDPPPADEPKPLPPVAGYTGVRIFGDPLTCNPCRLLETDLQYLQQNHGWTVSRSPELAADWQILPARESDTQIPLIEVWQDGQIVGRKTGYSEDPDPRFRGAALLQLVKSNPRYKPR